MRGASSTYEQQERVKGASGAVHAMLCAWLGEGGGGQVEAQVTREDAT